MTQDLPRRGLTSISKVPMLNYTRYVGLFFPKRSSVVPYPSAAL